MNGPIAFVCLSAVALLAATSPSAAAPAPGASGLKVVARIAGPDGGWDYASFDPARRRVYVAHGSSVMAIDADTGKLTADFAAGAHLHAVVSVPGTELIVTTNSGDDTARVLSAADGKLIASIPTAKGPDGATYDPSSGLVMVIDGDSGEVTMVDPKAGKAVGSIKVGDSLEFPAADGKGRLYINVEDKNEIAVVDIAARKAVGRYPLGDCHGPTGLALVAGNRLISACANGVAKILDAPSGRVLATLKIGERPDSVLYDETRSLAYIPSALTGTLAVIALSGKDDNTIIDTVATQAGARTGAADPKTGKIYLPTAQFLPAAAG
ncbi:MAG: PQQ-binding-like beta-propeller repeat protein, partial [Pseudomonadota bacterium]|nr:PQQ-binding-like beta-propeller repeat protein [Pseudomonadota bacterium]